MNRRNRIDSKIRDFFGSDPNNSDRKPATINPILVSTSPRISKPQIETKTESFEKKFFLFLSGKKVFENFGDAFEKRFGSSFFVSRSNETSPKLSAVSS